MGTSLDNVITTTAWQTELWLWYSYSICKFHEPPCRPLANPSTSATRLPSPETNDPFVPDKLTSPTVPFGAENSKLVYPERAVLLNADEKTPSFVSNPACTSVRSPGCGAKYHLFPAGPVSCNPAVKNVNAAVGPVDQPWAWDTRGVFLYGAYRSDPSVE